MKNTLLLLLFGFAWSNLAGQLTNNGATIVIEQGATLVVEGDLNNASGQISNSGTLEVMRNLYNNAALNSANTQSEIIFSGSDDSEFDPGGSSIRKLRINKSGGEVQLLGDLKITELLDFSGGSSTTLAIENSDLLLGSSTTISGFSSSRYISTTGAGFVEKALPSPTFTLPIGGNTLHSVSMDITGLFLPTARVRVRHRSFPAPNLPADATDYLNYHVEIQPFDIGNYRNEIRSFYAFAPVTGNINLIKGASYANGEWSYNDADRFFSIFTRYVSGTMTEGPGYFTGTNFYGKTDPLVYLQGSYLNGSNMMRTDLSDNNLIPLASPYTDAPATAPSIPAGAVDWVKIELRGAGDPGTALAAKSAFLLADGSVVDVDGSSMLSFKDAPTNGFISIHHRNHLPIRSSVAYDLSNPPLMDLTTPANVYDNASISGNTPMKSLGGGAHGMWAGDANGNGNISFNGSGNDRGAILVQVGFGTPNNPASGYNNSDLNMNGSTSYNGSGNDRSLILLNVGFATPNRIIQKHVD